MRTFIPAVVPAVGSGHTLLLMPEEVSAKQSAGLLAIWLLHWRLHRRQKMDGTSLTYFVTKQLAVLRPESFLRRPVECATDSSL